MRNAYTALPGNLKGRSRYEDYITINVNEIRYEDLYLIVLVNDGVQ
jgi:hypothetical protein